MTTTRNIKVNCAKCGEYLYDSDKNEFTMCHSCRNEEIEQAKLERENRLQKIREVENNSWNVRKEHPDSEMY